MQTQMDFEEVMQFLDYAKNKGLMKGNTAASLKAACAKIEPYLEGGERNVVWVASNIDQIYRRVFNKDESLTPDSRKAYQSRTKRALDLFIESKKNPTGWDKNIRHRASLAKAPKIDSADQLQENDNTVEDSSPKTTDVNYPLRRDFTFKAKIPRDIKMIDVWKLLRHLVTYAEDFDPIENKVWFSGAGGSANPNREIEG